MILILLSVTPYLKLSTKVIICIISIVYRAILKEVKYKNTSTLKYIKDILEIKIDIFGKIVKNRLHFSNFYNS